MMQLALLVDDGSLWREISDKTPFAARFYDGHYSRQTHGSSQLLAPGQHLLLWHETRIGVALWGVVFNVFKEQFRLRNSIFQNESGTLSSSLIIEATRLTFAWCDRRGIDIPLRTEIGIDETQARRGKDSEPGWCYLWAGWWKVRDVPAGHGRSAKVELEAAA